MPYYNTPEAAAKFLSDFTLRIDRQEKGTFSPAHVKYSVTLSKGGKEFHTPFESNPEVHGEPTVTQVFSALALDAVTARDYGLDEFVDESCEGGMKPSAAIRAYNSCKESYDWMRNELYLSGPEIEELRQTLDENEVEVNELVEKAAQAEERPTLSSMDRQCRDSASALSSDGDGREPARSETEH